MNPELTRLLREHFQVQGDFSPEEATIATECLRATALNVGVETTHPIEDAKCFLAFSFGGRHDQLLNVSLPGPQNQQIARAITRLYRERKNQIYVCVQWEIVAGSDLAANILPEHLHILRPPVDPMNAKHGHYPTQRLWADMQKILSSKGIDITQVPVGLFAHRHHLPRVAEYARSIGVNKIASPIDLMPKDFDPLCAYSWTRDFRGFYLSNAVSAMAKWRNEMYCTNPPFFPQ